LGKLAVPGGPIEADVRVFRCTYSVFPGQAPALGAEPVFEGRRRFRIGSPRSYRSCPRGLSLGFAWCCRLGGIRDRWFLLRKNNGWRPLWFRLEDLPWCFGGPLWDFRWRYQTGFRRVRKRLFTFFREVHGIEPLENASSQVIDRSAPREAKARGQGQRNEHNPSTDPQWPPPSVTRVSSRGNCDV
jgi:hypothetical protein